jgi:TPR repeat protein
MSQTSIEIRLQILVEAAKRGDYKAISELTNIAIQILEGNGFPQNTVFGFGLLKNLASYGDKISQGALAEKIAEFALKISESNPKLTFDLFAVASKLGNLQAKRNLAVCFFKGQGTERQPDKAIGLLKECYEAGNLSILEDMNAMAKQFLDGDGGIAPDLQKAVELFTFAAEAGHAVALKNFALLGGWFYSGVSPCPKNIPQGIAILKMTAKLGDERALSNLGAVGAEMLETEPKIGFETLASASELGNLEAKRNLAVCFLDGRGTERDISQVISLLKTCYLAGDCSILDDISTVAVRVLSGSHGCQKDVALGIKLFTYAAKYGNQEAQNNLLILANHFLAWQKFEADYGIQQDIPKGLRILHYLENTLKDTAANEQLTHIRALKIPIPMPNVPESVPSFKYNDLTIGSSTAEEPHCPCTVEFLRRHNIAVSATGVVMRGSDAVLSPQTVAQFIADRNAQKLEHFTGALNVLNQHFPAVSPIQEIVCGYIPNEVSPLFFQYQQALVALDKEPQLEFLSMSAEETPSDSNPVKLHVACT